MKTFKVAGLTIIFAAVLMHDLGLLVIGTSVFLWSEIRELRSLDK